MSETKGKNGGKRPGAGRPKGRLSNVTAVTREEAMLLGDLPHQWLLRVCRGEPIPHKEWVIHEDEDGKEISRELVETEYYPSFNMRVEAAKAAAPFYAPKIAAQVISITQSKADSVPEMLREIAEKLPS